MGHHSVLSFPQEHTLESKPQIIIMNPMIVATAAILAMSSIAEATLVLSTSGAYLTGITVGTTAVSASTIATLGLLGAAALLKGAVLGQVIARGQKNKRSAEDNDDAMFFVLNSAEPAQCYRRLICDMSAGAVPDHDKILSLFNTEVSPASPKFEYVTAAKVGKLVKNANSCEVRYSCPLNSAEIAKLFA